MKNRKLKYLIIMKRMIMDEVVILWNVVNLFEIEKNDVKSLGKLRELKDGENLKEILEKEELMNEMWRNEVWNVEVVGGEMVI